MNDMRMLYEKYYVKKNDKFLALISFQSPQGIDIKLGVKNPTRKLAIKIGSRRWSVKRNALRQDLDPVQSLLELKQQFLHNMNMINGMTDRERSI